MGDLYRNVGQSTADGAHRHALSRDRALRAMLARGRSCVPNTGCCRRRGSQSIALFADVVQIYERLLSDLSRVISMRVLSA